MALRREDPAPWLARVEDGGCVGRVVDDARVHVKELAHCI